MGKQDPGASGARRDSRRGEHDGAAGPGFSHGVGMAIAERHLAARFNRPGHDIVDDYTYGIVSDGDLMEGVASEAVSLAGHLKLGRLIYLYDNNHITLAGETRLTFTEDVPKRFEAYGWHVQSVADGNDVEAISQAIAAAQKETGRPSLISVRTHIGYGSPRKQDTFDAHGSPLGPDEVAATKKNLGWPVEPRFHIPGEAGAEFRKTADRGAQLAGEWENRLAVYGRAYPELKKEWDRPTTSGLPAGWDREMPVFPADSKGIATRSAGGQVMNAIAPKLSSLVGGSADLDPSTNTALKKLGNFQPSQSEGQDLQGAVSGPWGYEGANMAFGVREHAMEAFSTAWPFMAGFFHMAVLFSSSRII